MIQVRSSLNIEYIDEYGDITSPEYEALREWLIFNFTYLCDDIQLTSRVSCVVKKLQYTS